MVFQASRERLGRSGSTIQRPSWFIFALKAAPGRNRGPAWSIEVGKHLDDEAGGQRHQGDIVVQIDIGVAIWRGRQAVEVGVLHIVVAELPWHIAADPPGIAVPPGVNLVVAPPRRVPVAGPAALIALEAGSSAPPGAIVAVPALALRHPRLRIDPL